MTKKVFVAVFALVALTAVFLRGQQTTPSIQGVWRAVELTITNPNGGPDGFATGTHTNLQTQILIFAGKHYSLIADTAATPRPRAPLKVPGQPTREELMSRYGPINANAGTYEVSGNTLTRHVMVAKNPGTHGSSNSATIKLEGNNLWLTIVGNTVGDPIRYPTTVKYVRLE